MASATEMVQQFARLQATDDGRQLAQAALVAVSLPPSHPLATTDPFGDGNGTLIRFAQIRAGMDIGRLGFRVPGWEAQMYAAAYIKEFLVAVRQELLTLLCDLNLSLPPQGQEMAQATVTALEEALRTVGAAIGNGASRSRADGDER